MHEEAIPTTVDDIWSDAVDGLSCVICGKLLVFQHDGENPVTPRDIYWTAFCCGHMYDLCPNVFGMTIYPKAFQ